MVSIDKLIPESVQRALDGLMNDWEAAEILGDAYREARAENERLKDALRYIIRTYNNGAMTDARIASSMCQAARSALDSTEAQSGG